MSVTVGPILADNVAEVAAFLTAHFNPRVPMGQWEAAVCPPDGQSAVGEDYGVLVRDDERLVGAYLAIYSERATSSEPRRFCNLAAWYVLPEYRLHSLRMLKTLLGRSGYHFTDLSPSGNVVALNRRLGFVDLDTSAVMWPNLPWPTAPGRLHVVTDSAQIERRLDDAALQVFRDHRGRAAAQQVLLHDQRGSCLVVFRRDRRKDLQLFASVLHVSDRAVFRRGLRAFSRHLLLRRGIPVTLLEERVVGPVPWPAIAVPRPRPKMYRSETLRPDEVDYLYSELTHVAW